MKKFRKLCLSALAVTSVLFVSCFNITGGKDVNPTETVGIRNKNKKEITLTITNLNELSDLTAGNPMSSARSAAENARTIVSEGYAYDGLKFYITGTSANNDDLTVTDVTADIYKFADGDTNKGKVTLTIDEYAWNLKLYACPAHKTEGDGITEPVISGQGITNAKALENVQNAAVLAGTTYIDMYYTTQAYFTLSPNGLGKEAQVDLTLQLGNDWPLRSGKPVVPEGYKVKAGIYDIETGALIETNTDGKSTEMTDISFATITVDENSINSAYAYTANTKTGNDAVTVDCGTYNFIVTFENEETHKIYVWSDIIIILPGKGCKATVTIPNVIGKLPAVPENFQAYYIEGSEDEVTDMYKVLFQWDDKSNNETYFEIQMIDRNELAEIKWDTEYASDDTMKDWTAEAVVDTTSLTAANLWTAVDAYFDAAVGEGANAATRCDYPSFVKVYGADFYTEEIRAEGALLANNKTVTMYLPLGTSYEARIYAVNDAGRSVDSGVRKACEVAINATAAANTPAKANEKAKNFKGSTNAFGTANNGTMYTAASGDGDGATPAKIGVTGAARTNAATTISRFRIRYNLQGGTYDADGPEGTTPAAGDGGAGTDYGKVAKPQTGSIVEYYSQDSAVGNFIIYPEGSGDDTNKPVLNFGGSYYYEYWATSLDDPDLSVNIPDDDDGTAFQKKFHVYPSTKVTSPTRYNPNVYKDYKNVELYAKYRVEALIEIIDPTDTALKPEWISYQQKKIGENGTDGTEVTLTSDTAKAVIDIAKSSTAESGTPYGTMDWTVTVPEYAAGPNAGSTINYNFTSLSIKLYQGNVIYYEDTIKAKDNGFGGGAAADAVNTFSGLPLKRLKSGSMYNLVISAQYGTKEGGVITSVPLTLQIVDFPNS